LTTAGWLVLGFGTGNRGTLNVSNGTVTVSSDLYVGLNATGRVFLAGGTISAGSIHMNRGGLVDITGGTLIINGDARAIIGSYISNAWITANGGAGTLNVDYNTLNVGRTTVRAVPLAYGYNAWAAGWGVSIGSTTNDYDGDLLNNLGEYALNGNPTNHLDTGSQPTLSRVEEELFYRLSPAQRRYEPLLSRANLHQPWVGRLDQRRIQRDWHQCDGGGI